MIPGIVERAHAWTYNADGTPNVAGLEVDEVLIAGEVYMRRYYVNRARQQSTRFHEILRSDDARDDLHDHPWDFTSLLLVGSYVETALVDGVLVDRTFGPHDVLQRPAEFAHRLTLVDERPVWTFVVLGPIRRDWGFHTEAGWVDRREYHAAGVMAT